MSRLPRLSPIVLQILREALPGVTVTTWGADIDYRDFPLINIRRVGGKRDNRKYWLFSMPVVEMTCYTAEGLPETEQLYEDALEALFEAVRLQKQYPSGYLHSMKETMGLTQFSSLFMDSWRVQGLIQLGLRPNPISNQET
jgi:hypothetical protein